MCDPEWIHRECTVREEKKSQKLLFAQHQSAHPHSSIPSSCWKVDWVVWPPKAIRGKQRVKIRQIPPYHLSHWKDHIVRHGWFVEISIIVDRVFR